MNYEILKKHVSLFIDESKKNSPKFNEEYKERLDFIDYYQGFTKNKILIMTKEDIYQYLSKLWAMLIWGNKHYKIDKLIEDNGFDNFKNHLAELVWGEDELVKRWDTFKREVKGMGPAMMSEILCKTHPEKYMVWNQRTFIGLKYLKVNNLPRYDYQITGKIYKYLCEVCVQISKELKNQKFDDNTLLAVDYFIWSELQIENNAENHKKSKQIQKVPPISQDELNFIHNDIRDKVREIGEWLGFTAKIEQKVSEGSRIDTIWEATIGNMGRVIYIFEIQTKGSIDSLIINLLKSLNNPAVQGVVAVSDHDQIESIKSNVSAVKDLKDKLKYWDYEDVLKVHEYLEYVNGSINNLGLVPQGF